MELATYSKEEIKKNWDRKPYQVAGKDNSQIAHEWIVSQFGFDIEKWTVTPELAQELLDNMGLNRKLKPSGLARYSASIEKGRWYLSPQGIIFDENGKLIDGQHRLEAVIKSGVATDFVVFLGVPHDTPIDTGMSRNSADSLRIRGLLDEDRSVRANINIVNSLFQNALTSVEFNAITNEDRAAFINKYPDEVKTARLISRKGDKNPIGRKAAIVAGILAALIYGIPEKELESFCICLNSGCYQGDGQKSAIVLRKTILDQKAHGGGNGGRSSLKELQSMTEEAIQDFVNKKPRKRKYEGDKFPYSSEIDVKGILLQAEEENGVITGDR